MFHFELSLRFGKEESAEMPPGLTDGGAQLENSYEYTERRFGTGFCLPPE